MRTVGIKLMADVANFTRNIGGSAVTSVKSLSGELDKASKAGKLDRVSDAALGIGVGLVGVAAIVTKFSMDFEKQMSAVSAATHASAKDMDALRAAALQAGKDTQYSATDAAKGITELSKAGVSTADVLGGGLKGSLALAAAGQLDVGEAAETAASAMTQFKLKGDQIPHVADLLAAAAGKAQGSVHDMGFALNQAGLVASQTGLSIEDTTGTLAAFASAGLIGSDAGTSFKTMLLAIQNPAGKTADLMKDLGISAYDAQGNFVGIAKFAGILQEKLKNLTPQVRAQAMAQIFGNDAVRASSILYTQGQAGIQGWIDKTNDAGYAASTAAKLTDNLSGDIERLKGSLETLAISSGSGANSGLRVLAQSLNGVVNQFLGMPPAVGAAVTVIAGVGGAALLGLAGFIKLRKGLADAVEQLNAMGPAGEKAATGLGKAASIAAKATVVLAGLEVLGIVADRFGAASVNVDRLTDSLTNFTNTGNVAGEMANVFGGDFSKFAKSAQAADAAAHGFRGSVNDVLSTIPGLGSAVDAMNEHLQGTSFNQAKADMTSLDEALVGFMNTTKDYNKASALWQQMLSKSGLETEQLAALLPNAYKQLGVMSVESMKAKDGLNGVAGAAKGVPGPTGKATAATKEYANAADAAAGAARGELGALTDLSNRMKAEIDPVFGLISAEQGLAKAQKDAAAAVKAHGRNSTEAKAATRNLALAAIDLQSKAGSLSQSFDGKLSPSLIKTFKAAGLTDNQIKDVSKQFRQAKSDADKYDGKYVAKVSATGVSAVKASLQSLLIQQQALKKGISVSAAQSAFNKNSRGFSGGGFTGPGAKYEPAGIVHAGEYVFNAQATSKLGVNQLDEIQKNATMPGYAGGGAVMPFPVTASQTRIPSLAEALSKVAAAPGNWPSSPSAQRGDSGVWRSIVALINSTGPMSGHFGNAYRAGDPLWHGSGRAVDWMGFNQDRLATFLAARRPLELIHRTSKRDYAYTRGVNKGSFNSALMNAHRNHVHIAMANGGVINEPVFGFGASGRSYSFGENGRPETVIPGAHAAAGTTYAPTYHITVPVGPGVHPAEAGRAVVGAIQAYEKNNGRTWRNAP